VGTLALLVLLSLAIGGIAWAFFVWTVRSGQYEDPEGAKYRMLEDDEEPRGPAQAPPPRTRRARSGD
jgi:cbb3-type cytochrome oxidase maturation protein